MRKLWKGVILLILCFANLSQAEEPIDLKKLHQAIITRHKHKHSDSCVCLIPGPPGLPGFPGITGSQGEPGSPTTRLLAYGYAFRTTGGTIGTSAVINYDTASAINTNVVMDPATGIATVQAAGNYLIKFAVSALQPSSGSNYELGVLVNGSLIQGKFFTNLPTDTDASMSNSLAGQMIYALAVGDQLAIQNTATPLAFFSTGSNITAYLSLEKIN